MISKKGLLNSINDLYSRFKCLDEYDARRINEIQKLQVKVKRLELVIASIKNGTLQKQLQCAAKGHNFVFDKVEYYAVVSFPGYVVQENKDQYKFKCTNCGLIITKTKDELTPKERKALKDLGILEENENGKSPTTKN